MDKVYIFFENYSYKLVIVSIKSKLASIDERVIHITEEDVNRFVDIINNLDNKNSGNITDPVRFSIVIKSENDTKIIDRTSNTCKKFRELNKWIGDIYDR